MVRVSPLPHELIKQSPWRRRSDSNRDTAMNDYYLFSRQVPYQLGLRLHKKSQKADAYVTHLTTPHLSHPEWHL